MAETVKTSIEKSLGKTDAVTVEEASRASSVVDKAAAADPALKNEMNLEPWWQSGVGVFGTGGALWALGTIATQIGQHRLDVADYDVEVMVTATGSLASMIMVLYRRFAPNLKPMFWRWTG